MLLNKNKLDVSQILLTYVALCGDVARTAEALNLEPAVVQALADAEGWQAKIQRVTLLSTSGKPGDFERAQNKALAFVQGHRIRTLLDSVIRRFEGMSPEEICDQVSNVGKNGARILSARYFVDLAAAAEKASAMCYAALGDTVGERTKRDDEPDQMNVSALHAAVIQSLNSVGTATKPADQIVRELADAVCQAVAPVAPAERTEVAPPDPTPPTHGK
jgi:hypothetical protein